jgi:subtilase family serine protease
MFYGLPTVSDCSANAASPCLSVTDLSGNAKPSSTNDRASEIALDIQMIHAIAPKANILMVIAASSSSDDLFTAINTAANTSGVTAVSMSFGNYQYSCVQDAAFSAAITQNGLIFFSSSGDSGNYGGISYGGNYYITSHYPASSPFVTAVGGTQINNVVYTSTASETAWRFTGGGVDITAPSCAATSSGNVMPTWQRNFVGSAIASLNGNQRAVPDVSAVADSQHSSFAYYLKDHWVMGGGTSASAPLWGGIAALLGQYLSNRGITLQNVIKTTPGGFNGLLYQTKLNGTGSFRDVVSGNNNLRASSCTLCTATVGFDDLTGLGTPNVSALFSNLYP